MKRVNMHGNNGGRQVQCRFPSVHGGNEKKNNLY